MTILHLETVISTEEAETKIKPILLPTPGFPQKIRASSQEEKKVDALLNT